MCKRKEMVIEHNIKPDQAGLSKFTGETVDRADIRDAIAEVDHTVCADKGSRCQRLQTALEPPRYRLQRENLSCVIAPERLASISVLMTFLRNA